MERYAAFVLHLKFSIKYKVCYQGNKDELKQK